MLNILYCIYFNVLMETKIFQKKNFFFDHLERKHVKTSNNCS